jgi:hypothetical protein
MYHFEMSFSIWKTTQYFATLKTLTTGANTFGHHVPFDIGICKMAINYEVECG